MAGQTLRKGSLKDEGSKLPEKEGKFEYMGRVFFMSAEG